MKLTKIDQKEANGLVGIIYSIEDITECYDTIVQQSELRNKVTKALLKDPNFKSPDNQVPIEEIKAINIKATFNTVPIDFMIDLPNKQLYITSNNIGVVESVDTLLL